MQPGYRSVVLAIDVEPDGRQCTSSDTWSGTTVALQELAALRTQLEEVTEAPVHFNWFLRFDPQIERTWGRADWVTQACPDLIPLARKHEDLTGIHPHFWRWDDRRKVWFSDFTDPAWLAQCLRTSVEGYRSVFGVPPVISRCGDRWMGNDIVRLLRSHGIRYDLTVEPGVTSLPSSDDPYATASLPDFRGAPRTPYCPSQNEFLIPAAAAEQNGLWIVPITTTRRAHWQVRRRFPFVARACQPLNLALRPRAVWNHIRLEVDRPTTDPLVLVVRTGDLSQSGFLAAFRFVTTRLMQHPGFRKWRFTTVAEAVERCSKVPAT